MRMNLLKPAIRQEIYLFMFMLGGLALLKQPLHRGEESEGVDGRVNVISNERAPRPPNLQVAEPARRSRSEPNNLFGGSRVALLYILPSFPILEAGRCLRLILQLASQLFWEQSCWRNRGLDFCNFHPIVMPATRFPRPNASLCSWRTPGTINWRNRPGKQRTLLLHWSTAANDD